VEGDEITAKFKRSPAINAALISAAQKVEHYEMASYGCLHAWAGVLGNERAAGLLEEILDEEKAANRSLNELALATSNEEALGKADTNGSDKTAARKAGNSRRGSGPVATSRKRAKSPA